MNRTPYPHQHEAFARLRESLRSGKRRPMLQASTGFGKTVLAAMIIESALARGNRIIFVVPLLSLIDQTVRAFQDEGIDAIGVVQGFHELSDGRQPVQICSVQTLMKRGIPQGDLAIIDEAHRWFQFYGEWFSEPTWLAKPIIGLSATPWSKGLGKHYDDLIVVRSTQQLIDEKFLASFRVFAPASPDLKGVRTTNTLHGRDFNERDLAQAMDKQGLVADIVSTWVAKAEGRPTLVFAVNRLHAKHLEAEFRKAGITCAYVDAFVKADEREEIRKQFQSGDISVIVNIATMTTGVDMDVRCIVLARPTKSEMLFVQIVGRGLRPAPGKVDCLVFDHSDTTTRLGLVTDIVHEHLDDGKGRGPAEIRDPTPLPKKCPSCTYVKPAKVVVCPACGFKAEAKNKVKCEDGELVEITAKIAKRKTLNVQERRLIFGQLKHYGIHQNYRRGWVRHKFHEFTGIAPDGIEDAPAVPPSPSMVSWIKSRNIAYARGSAKVKPRGW